MKIEKLVRMANEIARNLRTLPDHQPGIATADHLRHFWTPGMRASLIAHGQTGGVGLDPVVLEAVRLLVNATPNQ